MTVAFVLIAVLYIHTINNRAGNNTHYPEYSKRIYDTAEFNKIMVIYYDTVKNNNGTYNVARDTTGMPVWIEIIE